MIMMLEEEADRKNFDLEGMHQDQKAKVIKVVLQGGISGREAKKSTTMSLNHSHLKMM
jgi:hypothetical protein